MRNLKAEAAILAPGYLVRVRECKRAIKAGSRWAAWQVHSKIEGARAGRQIASLVHARGTVFA